MDPNLKGICPLRPPVIKDHMAMGSSILAIHCLAGLVGSLDRHSRCNFGSSP